MVSLEVGLTSSVKPFKKPSQLQNSANHRTAMKPMKVKEAVHVLDIMSSGKLPTVDHKLFVKTDGAIPEAILAVSPSHSY